MTDIQQMADSLLGNPEFLKMFQEATREDPMPDTEAVNNANTGGLGNTEEPGSEREAWLKRVQKKLGEYQDDKLKDELEKIHSDSDGRWCYIKPLPGFCIKCITYHPDNSGVQMKKGQGFY